MLGFHPQLWRCLDSIRMWVKVEQHTNDGPHLCILAPCHIGTNGWILWTTPTSVFCFYSSSDIMSQHSNTRAQQSCNLFLSFQFNYVLSTCTVVLRFRACMAALDFKPPAYRLGTCGACHWLRSCTRLNDSHISFHAIFHSLVVICMRKDHRLNRSQCTRVNQ